MLTTGSVLAGFTQTRVQNDPRTGSRWIWKALALPLAMSFLLGAVGLVAVYFLGQTG